MKQQKSGMQKSSNTGLMSRLKKIFGGNKQQPSSASASSSSNNLKDTSSSSQISTTGTLNDVRKQSSTLFSD
jgi:hypothetical protein